ncbi:hypothetical protein PHISCL_02942 [Aspergillus sclerotialis]|uniref:Uncharacterized protein n=1 Tax=Aspergillus sclerotialis TaxID=2070753 RepID=A0A3A2ZQZ7_9EURO|nr:hypothetical protein PHISCL_02942 [Aspergillus sclerotialis]
MKSTSTFLLALFALFSTTLADKHCTPSFDYCAEKLIHDQGFTEAEVKESLKGTGLEKKDLSDILLHCKNPGDVGHAKFCKDGCKVQSTGSHGC